MEMPSLFHFLVVVVVLTSHSRVYAGRGKPCEVDGQTYEDGKKFTLQGESKCFKYKCYDGEYYLHKGECEDMDGRCREPGETWTKKCVTYTCTVKTEENTEHYTVELTEIGCKKRGGGCYAENEKWQIGCITYQCQAEEKDGMVHIKIQPVEGGCKDHDGVCQPVGYIWENNCNTFNCTEVVVSDTTYFRRQVAKYGCELRDGSCIKKGDQFDKGCFTYECYAEENDKGQMERGTRLVKAGCKKKGVCYDVDEVVVEGCFTYQCVQSVRDGRDYYGFTVLEGRCKYFDGECYPLQHRFTSKRCYNYECQKEEQERDDGKTKSIYKFNIVGMQCKDKERECREEHEIFAKRINGTTYSTCRCTMSPYTVRYDCEP